MGGSGEITLEERDVSVDSEGNISVDGKEVASLKIVDFEKPYSLKKIGNNLFETDGQTVANVPGKNIVVNQGFIELSNVDAVKSMTEMIEVLRAYESYQKAIQSMDEMTGKAINEVGRLV
jgi:flagellar basal-body rod protein FlgG